MHKKIGYVVALMLVMLTAFTATAYAASTTPDPDAISEVARFLLEAVKGGHYAYAVALGLMLVVALVRRYLGPRWAFLHSDAGGGVLALLTSFAAALATATAAGASWSLTLLWSAGGIAVAAAGGYSLLKKLVVEPFLRPLADKAPAWLKVPLNLVLWIFERPDAVETSTTAGAAAVTAKPAAGIAGITGAPRDVK